MKSDLEQLSRSSKVSVIQMASEELKTHPPEIKLKQKSAKKTLLIIGGLLLFLTLTGLALYTFILNPKTVEQPSAPKPPALPFGVEREATITVRLEEKLGFLKQLKEFAKEPGRRGTITGIRLKVWDGPQERFASLRDFADLMAFNSPASLRGRFESNFVLFFYHGTDQNYFGFAAKASDENMIFREMILWEPMLVQDLYPFFFKEATGSPITEFEDRSYRNIDWRWAKISENEDLGIAYTIFPQNKLLVVTTGQEAMERVIDRLFTR